LKLSIGLMVKNEEKNLERCLTSLQPLMKAVSSELIIVDTGSTDNTVAIAQKYTDQVYFHPWENDYAKMRNITVSYARGEWFFFIDADEALVKYDSIINFFTDGSSERYHAACIKINNLHQTGDTGQFSTALVVRLCRRTESFRFKGVIHEQPLFEQPLIMLDAVLVHYGYVHDDPGLKARKLGLYEPILKQAIKENPQNVSSWYYLSKTYATYKNTRDALAPAIKAYELVKKQRLKPQDYLHIYINLAYLYLINENLEKTIQISKEGLKIKEWVIDLWFYLAKAQAMGKKQEEAVQSYKKYLYYAEHYDQYADRDLRIVSATLTDKEEAYLDLSVLHKESGRKEEAAEALQHIESAEFLQKSAAHAIALFLELREYTYLEKFYTKLKNLADEGIINSFYQALENSLLNQGGKEQEAIYRIFAAEDTPYGLLNRIRLGQEPETGGNLLDSLKKLQLKELDYYFGDIFYFIIQRKLPFNLLDCRIPEERLNLFFRYLSVKYADFPELYYEYLQAGPQESSPEEMRLNQILRRTVLLANTLEEQQYEQVWDRYVEDGIADLLRVYNENILVSGNRHLLKNREEGFFYYMGLARLAEASDQAEYVRNLRNALREAPEMKKGIELLLKRIAAKIKPARPAVSDEMKAYAQVVKTNIQQFIDKGMLKEAGETILAYEQIIPGDPDIVQMKKRIERQTN